jgi:hypothetical protein
VQNFTLSCGCPFSSEGLYLEFTSAHGISKRWDSANLMDYYCGGGGQCVMVMSFYSNTQSLVSVGGEGEGSRLLVVGCRGWNGGEISR